MVDLVKYLELSMTLDHAARSKETQTLDLQSYENTNSQVPFPVRQCIYDNCSDLSGPQSLPMIIFGVF